MSGIDKMDDSTYIAVTEAMALAGDAMEEHQTETLLVISLADGGNNAILGGAISDEVIAKLESLVQELSERASASPGEVLHIWS